MSLALLFHYLLLNMFRMLVHPSSGTCDLLWIYFTRCIALVRCVLVLRCGILMLVTAQHVSNVSTSIFRSLRLIVDLFHVLRCGRMHKDTTPPQPNHTVTPTHTEPEQYNTWNRSTISRKLLMMDVLTFETCWAVNGEIIKRVTSSWSFFSIVIPCNKTQT